MWKNLGALILMIALTVLAMILLAGPEVSGSTASSVEITVASGDTLWKLAVNIVPDQDPRRTIAAIIEANGLTSPQIMPGQCLIIPGVR